MPTHSILLPPKLRVTVQCTEYRGLRRARVATTIRNTVRSLNALGTTSPDQHELAAGF